jgi:hypothetical protein
VTLSVDVTGADGSQFANLDMEVALDAWAEEIGPVIVAALKAWAPVAPGDVAGSGRLRNSIKSETETAGETVTLTFTANVPYAGFVVDGTAAHDIRPNAKRALFWPGAAHPVGIVHHPGTRPNSFAERAITPLLAAIQARLEAAVADQLDIGE